MVDHGRKIAYCSIPKIASTGWSIIMANNTLTGPRVPAHRQFVYHQIGHFGISLERYSNKLQNYTKFMVVRHPLERLISGYYDKAYPRFIPNRNIWFRSPTGKKISSFAIDKFHKKDEKLDKDTYNATFAEFVKFALMVNNYHWKPYFNKCGHCFIDYDYILRIETMTKDTALVLPNLYPNISNMPIYNRRRPANVSNKAVTARHLEEYDQIDINSMSKLLDKYKLDMNIFGYQFDPKTNTAICSFNHLDEKCC